MLVDSRIKDEIDVATANCDKELVSTNNALRLVEEDKLDVIVLLADGDVSCTDRTSLLTAAGRSVINVKEGKLLVLTALVVRLGAVVDSSRFATRASTPRTRKQTKSVASKRISLTANMLNNECKIRYKVKV